MQNSVLPVFRFNAVARWLPRLVSVLLFVALCALVTYWVLTFSAMHTIPVPPAHAAQVDAIETDAVVTLFGGSASARARDVELFGVVAELGGGAGAAIVSMDGGPAKAVRIGAELSERIRLAEIRQRSVVIERDGVRQEIVLRMQRGAVRAPRAGALASALPTSPASAGVDQYLPPSQSFARAQNEPERSEPGRSPHRIMTPLPVQDDISYSLE